MGSGAAQPAVRQACSAGTPPIVTAALGHASPTTTLRHYVHLIDAAQYGAGEPMADAVARARAELAEAGVRPVCASNNMRVLQAS